MVTAINSPNFHALGQMLEYEFEMKAEKVHTTRWQGMNVAKKPDMATRELFNITMGVSLPDNEEDLQHYRDDIQPNLPWADDHFEERVSGEPLNPGETWKSWPWALSADKFRSSLGADPCVQVPEGTMEEPIFNHTYMERYWPKWAANPRYGKYTPGLRGIRHEYGDMDSLIELLAKEPDTRQAYIPIFFPEDTGIGDGGRKPCTLGYHLIMRGGRLHIYYPMRSCDFIRHWRDDCYLTVRLLLWILDKCREINPQIWTNVVPGTYTMHCTSLHMFENDWTAFIKRRTT